MNHRVLTIERQRELLHCDFATGVIVWRVRTSNRIKVGDAASYRNKGYVYVRVDGHLYAAHRLIWRDFYGEWPQPECDHKDTIHDHNWIDNLRLATHSQNMQNLHRAQCHSSSGVRGVHWDKRDRKWVAELCVDRKRAHQSYHDTIDAAHNAYLNAKALHHPFQTLVEAR